MRYTPALVATITEELHAGKTISEIALSSGFSERSLIAKLSSLGLYKKAPYLTKMGTPSVRKSELVDRLAELMGEPPEKLESLEKANKAVLELLIYHLT